MNVYVYGSEYTDNPVFVYICKLFVTDIKKTYQYIVYEHAEK